MKFLYIFSLMAVVMGPFSAQADTAYPADVQLAVELALHSQALDCSQVESVVPVPQHTGSAVSLVKDFDRLMCETEQSKLLPLAESISTEALAADSEAIASGTILLMKAVKRLSDAHLYQMDQRVREIGRAHV